MRKRILSILALLLTVTQGAWAQLGRVLASDGKYYKTVTAATNAGTTASGMIVYWGDGDTSDNTYNQGLAIALSDVVNNGQWGAKEVDVTDITNTGRDAAISMVDKNGIANTNALVSKWPTGTYSYAANHCASMSTARPSSSSNWFLPSQGQFVLMMNSYGAGYGTSTSYAYNDITKGAVVTAINNALTNAGGTALSNGRYWTSTEPDYRVAADWAADNSSFGLNDKILEQNVRAMFAFSGATAAVYTVSYNANGGSGAPDAQTKDGGIDLTLSSTQPTRDGYTFAGWATSADGAVAYSAGGSYTTNDDIVLYAQWTTTYTSYTVTDGSVGYWPSADHDKLLDNNTETKWCTVFGDGSTATATCGEWVEFNTPHAIIPTGYILTTAEDTDYHYGRNPKNWTLKGKLNAGDAWTVLTDVTNASMPKANHTNVNFDISNTDRAYKYFRFEINAIDGSTYGLEENPQAYKFQLSRLLLKGTDAMFDASFATGSGGTGWSISPTSATDGTTVSVSYSGVHRVKSVKAKKKVEAKALAEVTAGDIGKIVGKDGKIYATKADAEAVATGNAVAMIAYVGSETGVAGYTHGLALALTDESSSGMYWNDAKTACTNKNTSATVESASWMLPSKDQWNKMIDACKNVLGTNNDSRDLRDGFTSVGGSNMESKDYWSSTEYENDSNEAWTFNFGYDCWYDYPKAEEAYPQVRACLAF